jgi:hypothetical protein
MWTMDCYVYGQSDSLRILHTWSWCYYNSIRAPSPRSSKFATSSSGLQLLGCAGDPS